MNNAKQNRMFPLLILAAVLFGLFRTLSSGGTPAAEDLLKRQEELRNLWYRIPGFPGAKNPTGAQEARPDRIVSERLYPTGASYVEAVAFYEKELPGAGWEPIGEQRDVPGFQSPVRVYRSAEYHLLVSAGGKGILLRITWTPDLNPLVNVRVMPE